MGRLADRHENAAEDRRRAAVDLDRGGKDSLILPSKDLSLGTDVLAEAGGDPLDVVARVDRGKVPLQDEVTVGAPGRATADRQLAEEAVELVLAAQVVVVGKGLKPKRLAEPSRTQKDENAAEPLEIADVCGAIDVDETLPANAAEICDAIGKLDHGTLVSSAFSLPSHPDYPLPRR